MKPANTENLRELLEGIWSGDLSHNQAHYYCGTSCCLAGWDYLLNGGVNLKTPDEADKYTDEKNIDPWEWSKEYNNLTEAEAFLLFSPESTRGLHELVLSALEQGRRLEADRFGPEFSYITQYEDTEEKTRPGADYGCQKLGFYFAGSTTSYKVTEFLQPPVWYLDIWLDDEILVIEMK